MRIAMMKVTLQQNQGEFRAWGCRCRAVMRRCAFRKGTRGCGSVVYWIRGTARSVNKKLW